MVLGALALYVVLAAVLLGLPVLRDPAHVIAGSNRADARLFEWSLAWWPHAISTGTNPLVTKLLFVPDGYHLMWTSSVPGLAIALWPVTALFGAAISYDVAMILSPALSAWTAFLLCRHVTGRLGAALVGGWLFGFSSYLLATFAGGHLHITAVFLLPVAALLALRHVEGRMSSKAYGIAIGVLLVAQFLVSTEMLATLVLFGGGLLLAAWAVLPERRARLVSTIRVTLLAGAVALVVVSPMLASMLGSGERPDVLADTGVIDFLNPFFPTELTFAGHGSFAEISRHYTGNTFTRGGYLGFVLIGILVACAARAWRTPRREPRLLLGFVAVTLVLSLGAGLRVMGVQTVLMPWWPFAHLPLMRYVLPHRFMAFAALAIAVTVALWLAQRDGRRLLRWAVAAVAVAMLAPNVGSQAFHHEQSVPAFFTTGQFRDVLRPGDRVFALPYGTFGTSLNWQREADFAFPLVGGYAEPPPKPYELPVIQELNRRMTFDPAHAPELKRFLAEKGATVVIVDQAAPEPGLTVLKALGLTPKAMGGVYVARLG